MFGKRQLKLVDPSWIETAPLVFSGQATIPMSAELAFQWLADTPSWPHWYPRLRKAEWNSPAPYGIGSTRTVKLSGTPAVTQQVVEWQPGHRMMFCATEARGFAVTATAEDFTLRPTSASSSELHWRMGIEASKIGSPVLAIQRFVFSIHPMAGMLQDRVPKGFASFAGSQTGFAR